MGYPPNREWSSRKVGLGLCGAPPSSPSSPSPWPPKVFHPYLENRASEVPLWAEVDIGMAAASLSPEAADGSPGAVKPSPWAVVVLLAQCIRASYVESSQQPGRNVRNEAKGETMNAARRVGSRDLLNTGSRSEC